MQCFGKLSIINGSHHHLQLYNRLCMLSLYYRLMATKIRIYNYVNINHIDHRSDAANICGLVSFYFIEIIASFIIGIMFLRLIKYSFASSHN